MFLIKCKLCKPVEFVVNFFEVAICSCLHTLGAVHILRQPPEGGEGVSQMLTNADEGG